MRRFGHDLPLAWQQFQAEVAGLGLALPADAEQAAGMVHDRNWTVYWLRQRDVAAIDVLAEHRHGAMRHLRFSAEGGRSDLPLPGDPYAQTGASAADQAIWQSITAKFAACRPVIAPGPGLGDADIAQPEQPFDAASYTAFLRQSHATRAQRGTCQLGRDGVPAGLSQLAFAIEPDAYRARLPRYRLASCPFCYQPLTEAIDTFSLNGPGWWRCEPNGLGWFGPPFASTETSGSFLALPLGNQPSTSGCVCLLAVDYGVNLHGQIPQEVTENWVWLGSPRPGLRPQLLADPAVAVVMQALPVGNGRARPYTLWLASYFRRGGAAQPVTLPADGGYEYRLAAAGERLWFQRGHMIGHHDHAGIGGQEAPQGRWCIWGGRARELPPGLSGRALLRLRWPVQG
ncbi:hypothetical protein [Chitinilyticum piscinae]|uniref:Uncharacterized protein n=1 Tax=Chitinilyticum piscinae TaxID=2866724 RepID=A0A8J7FF56_9NEIS|nr:hypothetical protein [Chitinilyticum piscinae]MBE9607900.1 hypothetical protein [Chitinilyticum piscinae]